MDTKSMRATSAAVIGARHARANRNGQDAAAHAVFEGGAAIVVADGCGSGASSEVGARLAVQVALRSMVANGGTQRVREDVIAMLTGLVDALPGEREQVVHEYLLFTLVAAVVRGDEVSVWAVGDGAYAIDGDVRELGPFADNMPPYLAYELLGARIDAHVETARVRESVIVATDGAAEVGLVEVARGARAMVRHPDALRRRLALQAKTAETIEWDARRVVRTPAMLQDDGAIALLVRGEA